MAIKIRLTRGGSKKRPFYRVVAADSRMPRDGRFIEKLGTYSPLLPKDDPNRVDLNIDKINEWLKKGAQVSDRISRLLENLSVLEPKKRDNPKKGKKHKATLERETAKSEKQSNNQEEISSEEKTNDAEESPDLKDVSEGETLEEKTNDADTNEVNDKKYFIFCFSNSCLTLLINFLVLPELDVGLAIINHSVFIERGFHV